MKEVETWCAAGIVLMVIVIAMMAAVALTACSQAALDAGFKNLTSAQCDNQQATLQNIPLMFVTPAQADEIVAAACTTLYGTAPAPAAAPGQTPVIK